MPLLHAEGARPRLITLPAALAAAGFTVPAAAAEALTPTDFTGHWTGWLALVFFVAAYALVVAEETIHLRKSKPVMVAAFVIWALVAVAYNGHGDHHTAELMVRHNLLEFAELFLFLLAAMTYINTLEDRGAFDVLRAWLLSRGFSLRTVFWMTGAIAFVLSPVADNLTTALLMATVATAVGKGNGRFVVAACISIVVAANAGGAFSPFGDITTLMVWQKGVVEFHEFFVLFVPSLVNWLVPAVILSFTIPGGRPDTPVVHAELQDGALVVMALFVLTIVMAVSTHNVLHLPPVIGMMGGLGLLKLYGYWLKIRDARRAGEPLEDPGAGALGVEHDPARSVERRGQPFNIFRELARAEWDTLMFFYGVILCVGGLGALGYLQLASVGLYEGLGPTGANILVGLLSAIVDNIPVMFAVLSMMPEMSHGHWLLVTLTAGVGGSLLSVGSAAGVAVMGAARGTYTFFAHLRWAWAIALGYAASIVCHFWLNAAEFAITG